MPLSKHTISRLKSLQQSRFRKQHGEFIAEGPKVVDELLASECHVSAIYATEEWFSECPARYRNLVQGISPAELSRISALTTPNKVVATAKLHYQSPSEEALSREIILALDTVSDPGNIGTIIRTAEWFGIRHIVCSSQTADVYNPKVVQAAMGSLFRMNICYLDLKKYLGEKSEKTKIFGTFIDESSLLDTEAGPGIILIGNESHGISPDLHPFIHHRISIPRAKEGSGTESLNASVATAVVLFEFCRRAGQLK